MWPLQLLCTCLCLQISTCYQGCDVHNLTGNCAHKHHYWVPALPPNITQLFLEYNYIREINSTSLRDYEQLENLDLGAQNVQLVLRNNAFSMQRKLKRLVLGSNRGLVLEPRAFAGLFRLQLLFLDYCKLNDSILEGNYLQYLSSLEKLDLSYNEIVKLRPGLFFRRLHRLTELELKLNQIKSLCQGDLDGFQGKQFKRFNLDSNSLSFMYHGNFDWEKCGNPFGQISFDFLDLSTNGLDINMLRLFFKAMKGTPIAHLKVSGHIGKGFSFNNLPDPDASTFRDLQDSMVDRLDLTGNEILALEPAVFSPLTHARIIDVSLNKVNVIKRYAFIGLQGHLRMLNLSHNLLGEVYSHTFNNLTELRVLDLSHNHIGKLGYEAFTGLPMLRALYLTGNALRQLGSPASLPNLDYLFLNDNRLKLIDTIGALGRNSHYVDISENRLTNLEEVFRILTNFTHLERFFFGGNFIRWCTLNRNYTVPLNNSLRVLDLHESSLQVIWAEGKCLHLFDRLENLLGLDLSSNSLSSLPHGIFRSLSSLIEIDLSNNALTFLPPGVFPASLSRLHLAGNFLASPDPDTFRSLLFLDLAGNRFHCDCRLEAFLKWLDHTNVTFLSPTGEFRCEFPVAVHNLPLLNYSTVVEPCEEDDEKSTQGLKLTLFVLSALLVTALVLGSFAYARLRGQMFIIYKKIVGRVLEGPKPAPPADEMQYDVFLCFSTNDYNWVETALLKRLDNQFSEENILNCCFEARDFLPGQDHLSNIRDAIWGSRKTVCIVSKQFLKDGWCLEAFTLAQGRMMEKLTEDLIMLVVGKVAHYQLMTCSAVRAFVQKREYLVWPEDPQDLGWFYEQLVSRILRDKKVREAQAEGGAEPAPRDLKPEEDVELQNIQAAAM